MVVGSLDAYHLAKDDPDFLPGAISSGCGPQRLQTPIEGELPNPHCAICHWLRSLGTSQIAHTFVSIPPAARLCRLGRARVIAPRIALTQTPARAPPASATLS